MNRETSADALHRLGVIAWRQGRTGQAIGLIRQAIEIAPCRADAHANLAVALMQTGEAAEAVAAARRSLAIDPKNVGAHVNLACALRARGQDGDAVQAFRAAFALAPERGDVLAEICALRQAACDWPGLAEEQAAALALCHRFGARLSPFLALTLTASAAEHLAAARRWAAGFPARAPEKPMAPRSGRRLRVGYLSADFHQHPIAMLVADMLERHDRGQFEIFGYSHAPDDGSAVGRRVVAAFDRFVETGPLSHAETAQAIEAHGIDILVDLMGYTEHARTDIPALRPAPVQVNFLGYPGSMGAGFIDYVIADPIVAPFADQAMFDERIVHLPHSYQPNDRRRPMAAVPSRSDCGLPDDAFVFCCLNASYKITPLCFDVWMRLLRAVPRAILWLLDGKAGATENLRRAAAAAGVHPARLVFAPKRRPDEHLARMSRADLFLDTLPYNAHTTASEALWAGLPLLTCLGESFAGRVAASLLRAVGLPELIAGSIADYEGAALMLADRPGVLATLRERLARTRLSAPLFDSATFTRDLETAFLHMADRAVHGLAPAPFAVADLLQPRKASRFNS